MAIDIGRIAYEKYVEQMNGITIDGRGFCDWSECEKRECDAWRHAACAVSQYLDQCKQDMEDEVIG
jgi:hypothetical protein